jgi:hypothetical protein
MMQNEYSQERLVVMSDFAKYVEKHRDLILDSLDYIWKNPETGYKEWKTHKYMKDIFEKLGYELIEAGDIPGFTAEVDTGKDGPTVAVFGELDALICATHPEADKETHAVHSCGHCAQAAALIGLAAALKEEGALDGMCGKIRLVAVPAEELIEVEYRESLRKQGIIKYFGGKPEFMWLRVSQVLSAALPRTNLYWRGTSISVFCKPFLQEVAKRFCRLLHLHFVGDCRRLCRPELAGRAPSQTSFTVTV